ncbi:MAG TPA: HIT family protein [Janthinobacterium sp.]|nr:HIT family protein [Janthinobacterium sp.]
MAIENDNCVFCGILAGRIPAEIVYRDEQCVALLDAFPLTRGHLLLIPLRHGQHIEDLPRETVAHLFSVGGRFSAAWRRAQVPATNLLINNGKAANQHVPHVHLHVIPRRPGDSLPLMWRYLTRFINPFAHLGRKERLAREAAQVRALIVAGL